MKFDKVRAFWGRKLLTVLLVPTILGCHFTAVQALADEAVVESGETTADSGDDSKEDQNNNDNQPAADDNQGNQGGESDDNSGDGNDNPGESSGEDSDGGSDGSGDAEDASSAGATTSEDAGGEASGSASTGASSDNAGTASSSDATTGNSSDASTSASSGASTDAAADASSGASSADAADAASSASSEDASGEAKDVSGNDAETAEFMDDTVVFNEAEVYFIYNYNKDNDLTSTDIYYTDVIADVGWVLTEIKVNIGSYRSEEIWLNKPQLEEYGYYHFNYSKLLNSKVTNIQFHAQPYKRVAEDQDPVIDYNREHGKDYIVYAKSGVNTGDLHPLKTEIDGYSSNSQGVYFVNPKDIKKYDDLKYVVTGVTNLNGTFALKCATDGETYLDTELVNRDEVEDLLPFQPRKYVFSVFPKPQEDPNVATMLSTPNETELKCRIKLENTAPGAEKSTDIDDRDIYVDGQPPEVAAIEDRDFCGNEEPIDENHSINDNSVLLRATDDNLHDITSYSIKGETNAGDYSAPNLPIVDCKTNKDTTLTHPISVSEPGIYWIDGITASDLANNESDSYTSPKFIYDPKDPILEMNGLDSDSYVEDDNGIPTFETNSSVNVLFTIKDGLYPGGKGVTDSIKHVLSVTRQNGDDGEASDSNDNSLSYTGYTTDGHTAKLSFSEPGTYTVSIEGKLENLDAGKRNLNVDNKTITFVIKSSVPKMTRLTTNNPSPKNTIYYTSAVTERVEFDQYVQEKYIDVDYYAPAGATKLPTIKCEKNSKGNTVVRAIMAEEGRYAFVIRYKRGSDVIEENFFTYVIDLQNPKVTFEGVENYSANNGAVAPVINCSDENFDKSKTIVDLKLTGANRGEVPISHTISDGKGFVKAVCPDFERKKDVDDLYVLEATVEDLAGRRSTEKLVFSVNRYGSVFVLGNGTKAMNEKYYTNDPQDVTITEINVDDLVTRDVSLTRDGTFKKLNNETDYRVNKQGSDTSWKTYTYNVGRTNFDKDGVYSVTLYTKDRATNEMDNKSRNAEIEFAVDKTAPSIVAADIEDKGVYKTKTHDFNVDVTDNMGVVDLTVYNNGKEIGKFTGEQLKADGNVETITLKESKKAQNITLIAVDVAGNKQTVVYKNVVVSAKDADKLVEEELEETEEIEEVAEQIDIPETLGVTKEPEEAVMPETTEEVVAPVVPEEPIKKEFPYKKAAAAAGGVTCVLAAAAAGIMIRRRKVSK